MALSNREKQQQWRERHIGKRRTVQRIAGLLLRQSWSDEHFAELGGLLTSLMGRAAIVALRRALKPLTLAESMAIQQEREAAWRDIWLREHPGRTKADYRRFDNTAEADAWRAKMGEANLAAERADWERDHPGREWVEHACAMTDRESADYGRWLRQRARKAAKHRQAERVSPAASASAVGDRPGDSGQTGEIT